LKIHSFFHGNLLMLSRGIGQFGSSQYAYLLLHVLFEVSGTEPFADSCTSTFLFNQKHSIFVIVSEIIRSTTGSTVRDPPLHVFFRGTEAFLYIVDPDLVTIFEFIPYIFNFIDCVQHHHNLLPGLNHHGNSGFSWIMLHFVFKVCLDF